MELLEMNTHVNTLYTLNPLQHIISAPYNHVNVFVRYLISSQ